MPSDTWPPEFRLDRTNILDLLTGKRFYSDPSAALREVILNAIDAVFRRKQTDPAHDPLITVTFDRGALTLSVDDNGIGMDHDDVVQLFATVGASLAQVEEDPHSVGEFGIGVVSYFMAGNHFELQTHSRHSDPLGLKFTKEMLAGNRAIEQIPNRTSCGTTVVIHVRDLDTFDLLVDKFPYWCRDVTALTAKIEPDGTPLPQGGAPRFERFQPSQKPAWVEHAHLAPISDPTGWDSMTGRSTISVLYRGVFVQECKLPGLWGIQGSIDVDPKHFEPRLNRESFVSGQFESDVTSFIQSCHPQILELLVEQLRAALERGDLDSWAKTRWANLWLSVPRTQPYTAATKAWDSQFRTVPAFELATTSNRWKAASLEDIKKRDGKVYVAPLAGENTTDIVQEAARFLRNTGRTVIRGIRHDQTWMKYASRVYGTTADLIWNVFAGELPELVMVAKQAQGILAEIESVAPLFTGPPKVDLVRLGTDSQPAIGLHGRLLINIDHEAGKALVRDALEINKGPLSLIESAARHAHQQTMHVVGVVRSVPRESEIFGPVRRQYVESLLS